MLVAGVHHNLVDEPEVSLHTHVVAARHQVHVVLAGDGLAARAEDAVGGGEDPALVEDGAAAGARALPAEGQHTSTQVSSLTWK